jgi:acyl dehydratase
VRFISPVSVGSRVRMRATLQAVEDTAQGVRTRVLQTFEREGQDKPVCVAESLVLYFESA